MPSAFMNRKWMWLFFAMKGKMKKTKKTKASPVTQFNAQEISINAQNNESITLNYRDWVFDWSVVMVSVILWRSRIWAACHLKQRDFCLIFLKERYLSRWENTSRGLTFSGYSFKDCIYNTFRRFYLKILRNWHHHTDDCLPIYFGSVIKKDIKIIKKIFILF